EPRHLLDILDFLFGLGWYLFHEVQIDQVYRGQDAGVDEIDFLFCPHYKKVSDTDEQKYHLYCVFSLENNLLQARPCFPAMKISRGSINHRPTESNQQSEAPGEVS